MTFQSAKVFLSLCTVAVTMVPMVDAQYCTAGCNLGCQCFPGFTCDPHGGQGVGITIGSADLGAHEGACTASSLVYIVVAGIFVLCFMGCYYDYVMQKMRIQQKSQVVYMAGAPPVAAAPYNAM